MLWEFVQAFKPPRTIELDLPLGATLGRPHDAAMQRDILRAGLALAPLFSDPWKSVLLPVSWTADGDRAWEETVRDLYRADDDDAGTLSAHQADHNDRGDVLAGNEHDFIARHAI